jgi:chorismate--pyruvate lyase
MKNARWRARCSPAWPSQVSAWLSSKGSLTLRLQSCFGDCRVRVNEQGAGMAHADEFAVLGLPGARKVRLRNVTLMADGQPRVVAHSVVKLLGAQSDWPFWRVLGSRSLGSVLFKDKRVLRSPLAFACLPEQHRLLRQTRTALAEAGLESVPKGKLYARRALYQRHLKRTPLLVTEVFFSVES